MVSLKEYSGLVHKLRDDIVTYVKVDKCITDAICYLGWTNATRWRLFVSHVPVSLLHRNIRC